MDASWKHLESNGMFLRFPWRSREGWELRGELQGPTWKQDILAATRMHLASTHLETYRTYLSTNLETYRTYKPRNLHSKSSQPDGPEGAGGLS